MVLGSQISQSKPPDPERAPVLDNAQERQSQCKAFGARPVRQLLYYIILYYIILYYITAYHIILYYIYWQVVEEMKRARA